MFSKGLKSYMGLQRWYCAARLQPVSLNDLSLLFVLESCTLILLE